MHLTISEILTAVGKIKVRNDRIEYLRKNINPVLCQILKMAYEPSVKWLLPEGDPPFRPSDAPDSHGALYREARRLYIFLDGGNPALKQSKRETLFVELLESVHPDDAKLLLMMKDNKFKYHGVTRELVNDAFPGLLSPDAVALIEAAK